MAHFNAVEASAQKATRLSLAQIKSFSPVQLRRHLEKTGNKAFSFVSEFPCVGRGNILRENIIDSDALNKEIDKILK